MIGMVLLGAGGLVGTYAAMGALALGRSNLNKKNFMILVKSSGALAALGGISLYLNLP